MAALEEAMPELCSYCQRHKFELTPIFASKPPNICKSCGTDTEKEKAKQEAADVGAQERSKQWGATVPVDTCPGPSGGRNSISGKRPSHAPTVEASWLPDWLLEAAASRGFSFNDDRSGDAAKAPLETSAEVSALWRRCMPRSGCWDILIQCRAVCFDVGTGEVAGAVYFDTRNKYIPCVGVDAKFRRRGLGSLLVVAAVTVCESANATIAGGGASHGDHDPLLVVGARPNLCVSPKDLETQPHLHGFYEALGFEGGRPDRGGNYTLTPAAASALLAAFKERQQQR